MGARRSPQRHLFPFDLFHQETTAMKPNITHSMPSVGNVEKKHRRYLALSRSKMSISILALFTFLILSISTTAQTTTSTIEGTIKDANGALISGAQVKATSPTLGTERSVVSNAEGFFRIVALPAGTYTITVNQSGFGTSTQVIELTLNRTVTVDVQLQVGSVGGATVDVNGETPLLTTETPATSATITPRQIAELPVNGRNYLDLLQLVPGTAINRQADPEGDGANPVLGERSGNNNFFIDGHENKDTVNGGAAAPFNQETISEFQVITAGYKAEFGQASGAIVNVITKSGGNAFHGVGSFFLRNDALDSSNSLDPAVSDAPYLRRYDSSFALGGPVIKDKFYFFGSAERIAEDRHIDFTYPPLSPLLDSIIRGIENPFDTPALFRESRFFLKLNQELGRHSLSQQVNYTNGNVYNYAPLSAGNSLPSTRTDRGSRTLLLGFADTMLLGDTADPWIVTLRGAYRGEPSDLRPAHPETGGGSIINPYTVPVASPFQFPSALGSVVVGNNLTASALDQQYTSISAIANKRFGDHDVKFGWNYLYTKVDGNASRTLANQLFATLPDIIAFAPAEAGIRLLLDTGGVTPADDEIHLRNHYNGLFVQDDWRIRHNINVSLGLRWDKDSEFEANHNFAPRLGVTWAVTPKTVIRGQFGIFYDQFRLGIARNVPQFGGANQVASQDLLFPRGLYGSPGFFSSIGLLLLGSGPCFANAWNNNLTDAQITAAGLTCTLAASLPMIGVDRLNNVVAAGHAPIPANSVISINNIQALSGLAPDQYLSQVNTAIGRPGYFVWGSTGYLTNHIIPTFGAPNVLEHTDQTPNTMGFSVGVQHEFTKDLVLEADYHHKNIRDILGVRTTNLAFKSRVTGLAFDPPGTQQIGFGPYYEGTYDALVLAVNKRFSNHYQLGASYSYSSATDNNIGTNAAPSDNFIGTVPVVTDPGRAATGTTPACPSQTNANGSFTACNGNFVAQAGTFWNGPDVDKGNSGLSLKHVFQVNGLVSLPWQFQISGIFRAQSGFYYSRQWAGPGLIDPDGNGNTNGIDVRNAERNQFSAPSYVNLDVRLSKRFDISERVKADVFFEFFNLFNRQNPAAIDSNPNSTTFGYGNISQVLPGREGQFGFRISF